jgi:predicted nucleotidyltransferase
MRNEIIEKALTTMLSIFKDRLTAAYLLGSFARGNPSAVSDIDFAIILDKTTEEDEKVIDDTMVELQKSTLPYASRLSLFWGSVTYLNANGSNGRFPPLDRLDLIKHGYLLYGTDVRPQLTPPSQRELIIAGAEFALEKLSAGNVSAAIMTPEKIFPQLDCVYLTKIILMPVRLLFTAITREIGYNDASATYYCENFPGPSANLVESAFQWRNQPPANKNEILTLLGNNALHELYQRFITYYITELEKCNAAPHLLDKMRAWQNKFPTVMMKYSLA